MNFFVVAVVLLSVALLASVAPAVRALRVDPVVALRQD
jgi:ABC-type lipoprotein release transport system permease subunit